MLTYGLDPHTYLNPVYNIMFVSSSNVIKHCEVRISSSMVSGNYKITKRLSPYGPTSGEEDVGRT